MAVRCRRVVQRLWSGTLPAASLLAAGLLAASLLAAGLLAALPATALAHEKWFTDRAAHATDWSLVLSGRTALALGAGALAVGAFALLQRLIGDPQWPRLPFFRRMAHGDIVLLAVQTAIALIYMAVRLTLFAPNLSLPGSPIGFAIAAVQIAVAFTLITGVLERAGAVTLLVLWLLVGALYSPVDLLAQALYAGIALTILLTGTPNATRLLRLPFSQLQGGAAGIVALRLLAGVSFLTIGLADKVWNPDLGEAFLAGYPHFNVARTLGIDLPGAAFVLAAGVVETAIGLLLISGYLTRVVILLLLVPFNLTVPFLPAEEMIGHLPIFGILYVLLVHGAGGALGAARTLRPRYDSADSPAGQRAV